MVGALNLVSYGYFSGGSLGNVLAQWQAMGVFDYALPFLLLFALTFGILMRIGIFTIKGEGADTKPNKMINAIIALTVALMALQFDFVSMFFSELFPRVGIALSIILVLLIVGGLFLPVKSKGFNWGLIMLVFVIIGIVIFQSLSAFGWTGGGYWIRNNAGNLIGWVVIIGLIVAVVAGSSSKQAEPENILTRFLPSPNST